MNPQYRKALVLVVLLLFLGMFLFWWTDRNPASAQYTGVTVQFGSAYYGVAENGVTATITVTLSQASAEEVKVDYKTSDGTAKEPDDYSSASGTLTFAPGKTTQTFQVTINDDLLGEADETVTLTLSNPIKAELGNPATATLTIEDDDGGLPTVEFSQSEYQFLENEGTVAVTVKLSAPAVEDVTVQYWVYPGSATEGDDYSAPAGGTLTFPAGETEQTIQVTLVDDAEVEEAETIFLGLFDPVNALPGTILNATLFVIDNEQALPTVQFESHLYNINEGSGSDLQVTVTLSKASQAPVTVTCKSYDGTATAPEDYYAVSTTLRFNPGETEKTFTVHIVDDKVEEDNPESFTLKLSDPSPSAALGEPVTAKVNIVENDDPTGQATVELVPAANQKGVTGDVVASTKGDQGQKHYVSPKKAGDFVILKAKMKPEGAKFEDHFEWDKDTGQAGDTPDTRKVSRDASGKTEVKIKKKGQNDVVDRMNVWVVWGSVQITREEDIKVRFGFMKPKVDNMQLGVFAQSGWTALATIEPAPIVDETLDIPDLKGARSQDVPGTGKVHFGDGKPMGNPNVPMRWDITRRVRIRFKSPIVGPDDRAVTKGKILDGLPNPNKIAEDYPTDDVEGNDDPHPPNKDVNPYSAMEAQPGKKGVFTPKGMLASSDKVIFPVFRNGAGANNDTDETHAHYGDFVRLQIGNGNTANYRNWYRISDFAEWRHVAILKKVGDSWTNNGSVAETNNNGW